MPLSSVLEDSSAITIGIFDDHPVVASGLRDCIATSAPTRSLLFCAHSRADLLTQLALAQPDIMILDVVAPDVLGLDLFAEVRRLFPAVALIAYTHLRSPILIQNLLTLGVKAYVNKMQPLADLLQALTQVEAGQIYLPPKYAYLASPFRIPEHAPLTDRELEILQLIAQEATSQEIAIKLQVSTKTIDNHRQSMFQKLEVKNVAGLVLAATRLGYLS
jgi:DNA-binding NarL/FixJ family response regulator